MLCLGFIDMLSANQNAEVFVCILLLIKLTITKLFPPLFIGIVMTRNTEITISILIFVTIIIVIMALYYSCNTIFICWLWLFKLFEYSDKNLGLEYPPAPVNYLTIRLRARVFYEQIVN